MATPEPANRWLLLIHQLPPRPAYLRVRVWRRLQALGAIAIKNSVYALPKNEETQEHFEWLAREIVKDGADASVCEARFIEGLQDAQVEALFNAARDADYRQIADDARAIGRDLPRRGAREAAVRAQLAGHVAKLRRRLAEVGALDFFGATGREAAEGLVAALEARNQPQDAVRRDAKPQTFRGRTWVTRAGIHVDRMASAWLIRRFIDAKARFKFVPARGYRPGRGEVRFDMYDAEFTHEGDHCTFEVLCARLRLDDPALQPIAEIVHDIDLKDDKFARPEVAGIERLIAGIAIAHREDGARLARGSAVFDDLYEYFRRKRA